MSKTIKQIEGLATAAPWSASDGRIVGPNGANVASEVSSADADLIVALRNAVDGKVAAIIGGLCIAHQATTAELLGHLLVGEHMRLTRAAKRKPITKPRRLPITRKVRGLGGGG